MNIVMLVSEAPISIPLVTYLGVKLLSHVVNSILVFGGSPKLFSIAAVIFYIPINSGIGGLDLSRKFTPVINLIDNEFQ